METQYIRVAVPAPLYRLFDYSVPASCHGQELRIGMRIKVPFGNGFRIGVVMGQTTTPGTSLDKIKEFSERLDDAPILEPELMTLLVWAAEYYHHPIGEVIQAALPAALRQGGPASVPPVALWALTATGSATTPSTLQRAPKQAALLEFFQKNPPCVTVDDLNTHDSGWRAGLAGLLKKNLVALSCDTKPPRNARINLSELTLNNDQQAALDKLNESPGRFAAHLIFGDTGSGKTEVYLRFIHTLILQGRQILVLVPEIGLTPQLVARFEERFPGLVSVAHSGLSDNERLASWLNARSGASQVILGTRSAVFMPLKNPGAILIDEEHDLSFKQQDGFRYSARDLAVRRASALNIPVILGSATPSIESFHNCLLSKYQLIRLPERAGGAQKPQMRLIDIKRRTLFEGMSEELLDTLQAHIQRDEQVLLFLNRRGYAPTLLCHDCGWIAECRHCDSRLTLHAHARQLRCHHCGAQQALIESCQNCHGKALFHYGQGTERIETFLHERFPDVGIVRIDRDTTRRKGALEAQLKIAHDKTAHILIGTQMLAKGHHFPDVTLVGMIDCDQGLFGADFRASERMAQLILQVAGRAGRAKKPGTVLLQTHHPEHELMQTLLLQDYQLIVDHLLKERAETELPPFEYLALVRADALDKHTPNAFLEFAQQVAEPLLGETVQVFGPMPAPMEKRAARYRSHLLFQAKTRGALHQVLAQWIPLLERTPLVRKVRWSIDVDPQEIL